MIWGKFPALDSKHSCSALQARGVREWNTRHLYLMISIYQQEQSQDVGSDLIPCSPVFTWGTHAHVFSSPRHYHTPLFPSHLRADNNQQLPDSAVQSVPHLLTAGTLRLWCRRDGEVSLCCMQTLQNKKNVGELRKWWLESYRAPFHIYVQESKFWNNMLLQANSWLYFTEIHNHSM